MPVCPENVWTIAPVAVFNNLAVLSAAPISSLVPSGPKATEVTKPVPGLRVRSIVPVLAFQRKAPMATWAPSGLNATG
jgi:hypothetical protein